MALFELPEDFNPASTIYKKKYLSSFDRLELERQKDVARLNRIGATITDYLALIKSGSIELSDFQALSLAVELYKVEALEDINISGNVDVSGGVSIHDGVSVSVDGHIETSEYRNS